MPYATIKRKAALAIEDERICRVVDGVGFGRLTFQYLGANDLEIARNPVGGFAVTA